MIIRSAAVIVAILFAAPAMSATYYVDPTGSNAAAGTISAPWASINYAATRVAAGDTVIAKDGTYRESIRTTISGTPGAPIIYRADNPGMAKILPPANNVSPDAWEQSGAYVTVSGFYIDGSAHLSGDRWLGGITVTGDHSTVTMATVRDIGRLSTCADAGHGIGVTDDAEYATIHANTVRAIGNPTCGQAPAADTQAPTQPTGLTATAAANQVDLTWTPSTDNIGVTGYRVYTCTGSGCTPSATPVASPTSPSYSRTGLTVLTTYGFRVAAVDAAGNSSAVSSVVYATTTSSAVWADEFDALSIAGVNENAVWFPWYKGWNVHALDGNSDKGWKDYDENAWSANGTSRTLKQIIEAGDPTPAVKARYLHEVSGGTLKLRCYKNGDPEFDSIWWYSHSCGMISSEEVPARAYATGYWETRMKINSLTKGQHLAIWLVPQDSTAYPPEIDIGEWINDGGDNTVARHFMNVHGETVEAPQTWDTVSDPNGWKTYGLEITPDVINWYRDGVLVRTSANRFTTDELTNEPAQPLAFMISPEHSGNWPGLPDGTTVYPFETEIDYVRYYGSKP